MSLHSMTFDQSWTRNRQARGELPACPWSSAIHFFQSPCTTKSYKINVAVEDVTNLGLSRPTISICPWIGRPKVLPEAPRKTPVSTCFRLIGSERAQASPEHMTFQTSPESPSPIAQTELYVRKCLEIDNYCPRLKTSND